MADRVQFILDRMAPLFKDLEKLEVFTKDEIKSIVKQRTDYEYLLRRRQLSPSDYYKYLKFELNLDELRALRCHQLTRASFSSSSSSTSSPTQELQQQYRRLQSSFLRHITYIFERSLRRFPDHLPLWTDYLSYLKDNKAYNILNTVFAKALSLYPTKVEFWLQASMHELGTNCNAHAARVLLQKGLRFNSQSEVLWLRYFELELWYSLRNLERRHVLGLAEKGAEEGEGSTAESHPSVGVPWVVYQHAVTAITAATTNTSSLPEDELVYREKDENQQQQFCLLFLQSCESVPAASPLHKKIYFDIEKRFGHTARYWTNLLAQYVHSTSFEKPSLGQALEENQADFEAVFGKRKLDTEEEAEADPPGLVKNNIDSIAQYLESCGQIVSDYQASRCHQSSLMKEERAIYSLLTDAFRRVMHRMAASVDEFLDISPSAVKASESVVTHESPKKKRKGKKSADDVSVPASMSASAHEGRRQSIERLAQILEKFRVILVSVSLSSTPSSVPRQRGHSGRFSQDELSLESDLLVSKHELSRCLSFLSDTTQRTFPTDHLTTLSDLLEWLSQITSSQQVSPTSPHYRDCSLLVWKIVQLVWTSSTSAFSALDIAHHLDGTSGNKERIDEMKRAVLCVRRHLPLLLVAQETTWKKDRHTVLPVEKLLTQFLKFLENPSPLLSEVYRSTSARSSGDEDEELTDEEDTLAECFPTVEDVLRSVIQAPICLLSQRVHWCLYYLRLSSTGSTSHTLQQTIDWIENCLFQLPQSLSSGGSGDDLTPYYEEALAYEMMAQDSKSTPSTLSAPAAHQRIQKLLQSAIQRCPSSAAMFQEMFAEAERKRGNHKLANHLLWRKTSGNSVS